MKHRTGHLFRRGSNFYVRWSVKGKVISKALRDHNGNPITTRRDAEEARQKVMAPFAVADEATALETIVGKLAGRKAELAEWEDKQNPPLPLNVAWSEYLASPNRPDTGDATLAMHRGQWTVFLAWMQEKHPPPDHPARLIQDTRLPRCFGDVESRNEIANLAQNVKPGTCWFDFFVFHAGRVAGSNGQANTFFRFSVGWLCPLYSDRGLCFGKRV